MSERYTTTMQLPVASIANFSLTLGAEHWRSPRTATEVLNTAVLTGSLPGATVYRQKPEKNTGAFVQGQFGIVDALFFTYGIRADWNPNFGADAKVKPGKYGLSYTHDIGPVSAKLRGSYGRSIRPPGPGLALAQSLTSLGYPSDHFLITQFGDFDYYKDNPDLLPEHQQGGEGGIELYFGSRGSLVITRYNQTVDNLITSVFRADSVRSLVPDDGTLDCGSFFRDDEGYCFQYQSQYLNASSIRNQGWELQSSVNIGPVTTRGTYSWTKSRILGITPRYRALLGADAAAYAPGSPFKFIPEHTWALGFTYSRAASTMSLNLDGIGALYKAGDAISITTNTLGSGLRLRNDAMRVGLPETYRPLGKGYAMADFNASHKLSKNVEVTLQVQNLTDYYRNDMSSDYASIGRQSKLGFRWRMN